MLTEAALSLQKADNGNELTLGSQLTSWMSPEAILGICSIDNNMASAPSVKGSMHYCCQFTDKGFKIIWDQLLVATSTMQYSVLCK